MAHLDPGMKAQRQGRSLPEHGKHWVRLHVSQPSLPRHSPHALSPNITFLLQLWRIWQWILNLPEHWWGTGRTARASESKMDKCRVVQFVCNTLSRNRRSPENLHPAPAPYLLLTTESVIIPRQRYTGKYVQTRALKLHSWRIERLSAWSLVPTVTRCLWQQGWCWHFSVSHKRNCPAVKRAPRLHSHRELSPNNIIRKLENT